jgi:hypothetical protein
MAVILFLIVVIVDVKFINQMLIVYQRTDSNINLLCLSSCTLIPTKITHNKNSLVKAERSITVLFFADKKRIAVQTKIEVKNNEKCDVVLFLRFFSKEKQAECINL